MEVINIAPEANPPQTGVLRIPFREHYGKAGKQYEIWITPLAFLKAAAKSNADVKPAMLAGKAYQEILRVAQDDNADLIVIGVQGRSPMDLQRGTGINDAICSRRFCGRVASAIGREGERSSRPRFSAKTKGRFRHH